MRKLLVILFPALCFQAGAQTLFTYGKNAVSKEEFLRAFHRNQIPSDTAKNALADYLDLYISYKLKIQEARDMRLDTLPFLRADLESFRHQIENNYTYDKKELQLLTEEALRRSKKDIRITAYTVMAEEAMDSATLRRIAEDVRSTLQKNSRADLSQFDKKNVRIDKANVGFVTVFTLPYQIENIVYGLKPGGYSQPFYSDHQFIIFKQESERPAAGKVEVAQILLPAYAGHEETWKSAEKVADSLYQALMEGADFGDLAASFSADRKTSFNGGRMPEFGVGKYAPEFEDHAFALHADGDISKPFRTAFGFHILKRITAAPVPQAADADFEYEVRQNLLQDERAAIARRKLVESARSRTGFQKINVPEADLYRVSDSFLLGNREITSGEVNRSTPLFRFNDGAKTTVHDWEMFLRNSGKAVLSRTHDSYKELWPEFIENAILTNYKQRLENFDPEFASQLDEFREGNMLFELMHRKVWGAANEDSAGLKDFYEQHKNRYKWNQSADAIIFAVSSAELATQYITQLKAGASWRTLMEKYSGTLQADSGRYELDQLIPDKADRTPGITKPVVNEQDGSAYFVQLLKMYPAGDQRSFQDARGLAVEDYQKKLEENWIDRLKKKYPVKVNNKTWTSLLATAR